MFCMSGPSGDRIVSEAGHFIVLPTSELSSVSEQELRPVEDRTSKLT
jgi:hypothetical protein